MEKITKQKDVFKQNKWDNDIIDDATSAWPSESATIRKKKERDRKQQIVIRN